MIGWLRQAGAYTVEHRPSPHFSAPADLTVPRAGVLHTTEGPTVEGAESVFDHHYAPQFLLGRDVTGKVRILQLVQIGTIGAALEAHNALAIAQIEMVGFSKPTLWLPDDETLSALVALMATLRDECGIPLIHPWADGDFGSSGPNPHRSSGKFGKVAGWFGHGDIPNNSHWDPGAIRWSEVLGRAAALPSAGPTVPPPAPARFCPADTSLIADQGLIRWAQARLNMLGYAHPTLIVDGVIGMRTETAIHAFQAARGLYQDGALGPQTIKALTPT